MTQDSNKNKENAISFYKMAYEGSPSKAVELFAGNEYIQHNPTPDFRKVDRSRGKGVYKALVMRRLKDLKELNIRLAASVSREKTSAPILEKLGFQTAYRDEIFQYDLIKQVRTEQL